MFVVICPTGICCNALGDEVHNACLSASSLVHRQSPVGLVQPQCRESVDAFLHAQKLEVHTVHLQHAHRAFDSIFVLEEHPTSAILLRVNLLCDFRPHRCEILAVAAPPSEEIDEGVVVRLNDMLEISVIESVMRAVPIGVKFFSAILFFQCQHLFLMNIFFILRESVRPHRTSQLSLLVDRSKPEVLRAEPFFIALCKDGNMKVATINVVHVDIKIDLQLVTIHPVQHHGGGVGRPQESYKFHRQDGKHSHIGEDGKHTASLRNFHKVPWQPSRCCRSQHIELITN
mmetsp:Transcript_75851/g.158127  ORF Transcript_75851/g.158127 Transcript_75851/m.158127 type:complete len:287 (-) Transcript_75851:26-886(-)